MPSKRLDKYGYEMDATFWMDGFRGVRPEQVSHSLDLLDGELDPAALYGVFGSFEGEWLVARFDQVERDPRLGFHRNGNLEARSLNWHSSLSRDRYISYVGMIKEEIERGWVYQVNACRLLFTDDQLDLSQLFATIQEEHHAPAAAYFKCDGWEIASASPETFFKVVRREGRNILVTRPIKGTSRTGHFAKKDAAENVMIVDLMRNDISPLCIPGTVQVPRLLHTEEHPGLFHLVSDVEGELRSGVSWSEILRRLAPAGSITGAPKSSALEVISRVEPYRGAYCGTVGWIHDGQAHFSVLIRTFFKDSNDHAGRTFFGTGAGITWGSDPSLEWDETELKAERLISLSHGRIGAAL